MTNLPPNIDVSVVVIRDANGRILLDYNDEWKAFTLPMSKIHDLPAEVEGGPTAPESPLAAAVRAAAEVLGRPLPPGALREVAAEVSPYSRSLRDGKWKRYDFRVFTATVNGTAHPLPGHVAVWLTPADVEGLEPISPTVGTVLRALPE